MFTPKGCITALITPFIENSSSLKPTKADLVFYRLVKRQMRLGADGVVVSGTTGESPTLSHRDHEGLLGLAIHAAGEKIPVIAGTGSNSTYEARELTKSAKENGADAALVVVPYYNKPSQDEIYEYFRDMNSVGIPIIAYDVPGRTAVGMTPETTQRVLSLDNIVALKDATGNMDHSKKVLMNMPEGKVHLSGNDNDTFKLKEHGCEGVISVVANIDPGIMKPIVEGSYEEAMEQHEKYKSLMEAMFIESNPKPVKEAMYQLGIIGDKKMRKPLIGMSTENGKKLKEILDSYTFSF